MSIELVRLRARDFDEAIDFINLVFSQASSPHDFVRMLPRLLAATDTHMSRLLACRRDGRIRAVVGAYPMSASFMGRELRVTGIGNVATHMSERGSGMMRMLMDWACSEMKLDGTDMSVLGGYRRRYNYFGYEKSGQKHTFSLSARNIRDNGLDALSQGVRFEPVEAKDGGALDFIRSVYESQPFHVNRGDNKTLFLHLSQWLCTPYLALDAHGEPIGYVVAKQGGAISESFGTSCENRLRIIGAWLPSNRPDGLELEVNPWEIELIRALDAVAERVSTSFTYMYNILSWQRIADASLALRAEMTPLPSGELVIEIENTARLALCVERGYTSCTNTTRTADITLSRAEATRFLFGPLPPYAAAEFPRHLAPLMSWFPLPLSWHRPDNV